MRCFPFSYEMNNNDKNENDFVAIILIKVLSKHIKFLFILSDSILKQRATIFLFYFFIYLFINYVYYLSQLLIYVFGKIYLSFHLSVCLFVCKIIIKVIIKLYRFNQWGKWYKLGKVFQVLSICTLWMFLLIILLFKVI